MVRRVLLLLLAAGATLANASTASAAPALKLSPVTGLPPSAARDLTLGPAGEVWVTSDVVGQYVARISGKGRLIAVYRVPGGGTPDSMARGPDGAMWITLRDANAVARVTREGSFSFFPVPTPAAQPRGIALGPDNALWVTLFGAHRVARLTTAGGWSEFTAGLTSGGEHLGITRGPDGALWLTEPRGDRIVRMTTSGAVKGFFVSNVSGPEDVALGFDGNLWFTEDDGDRVGRVTPKGNVKEFQTGITPGGNPFNITSGPDDAMWFTLAVGNRVARVTPDGGITEYRLPKDSSPRSIVLGPDRRRLWVAFAGRGGGVVRFRPPLAPVVPSTISYSYSSSGATRSFGELRVLNIRPGARVEVSCRGRGCPLRRYVKRGASSVDLRPRVRALRVGARMQIRVVAKGWSTRVRVFNAVDPGMDVLRRCIAPRTERLRTGCG